MVDDGNKEQSFSKLFQSHIVTKIPYQDGVFVRSRTWREGLEDTRSWVRTGHSSRT